MATIKSFTSLEQSRKLAEILPLESSDMLWGYYYNGKDYCVPNIRPFRDMHDNIPKGYTPAWSLATLLNLMICPRLEEYVEGVWDLTAFTDNTLKTPIEIQDSKDPINACIAMIEKLHELKML